MSVGEVGGPKCLFSHINISEYFIYLFPSLLTSWFMKPPKAYAFPIANSYRESFSPFLYMDW